MLSIFAIMACFIVIIPAASSAVVVPQKGSEYQLGRATVSFKQAYATIKIGQTIVTQSWKIYEYSNGQMTPVQLQWNNSLEVKQHSNPYYVLTAISKTVKVGAITGGITGGVEQAIVITNLLPSNATFVVHHQLYVSSNGSLVVAGNNFDDRLNYRTNTNEVAQSYSIPTATNSIVSNGITIDWLNAESTFIGGEVTMTPASNQLTASFGLITIPNNGTFTIDPSISSYPVEAGAFSIYDSSYNLLGEYTLSAMAPDNYVSPGVDFSVSGATAYQPVNSNYGVHEIKNTLSWNGDNLGNSPSNQPNGVYLYW